MIDFRNLPILICLFGISQLATAQDFEPVQRRLGLAISEGEITIAQAHAMMQALKGAPGDRRAAMLEQGLKKRMDVARRRLGEAVRTGRMTESQAQAERARIEREVQMMKIGMRIRQAVARGELTEEEGRAKMDAVRKELDRPRVGQPGIEDHFRRLGVSGRRFTRVKAALKENGVTDEQIEPTLGGMLRVMHMIQSATAADREIDEEMDERLREYFTEEVGLKPEQIELVQQLATRVAIRLKNDHQRDDHDNDDEHHDDDDENHDDAGKTR